MGFNADSYIAKIAVDELADKAAGYNPVSLPSGKIMERSAQGKMTYRALGAAICFGDPARVRGGLPAGCMGSELTRSANKKA